MQMNKEIRNSILIVIIVVLIAVGISFAQKKKGEVNSATSPSASQTPEDGLLDPTQYGLPSSAKEVRSSRTEYGTQFELSPGEYADVSFGNGPTTTPNP